VTLPQVPGGGGPAFELQKPPQRGCPAFRVLCEEPALSEVEGAGTTTASTTGGVERPLRSDLLARSREIRRLRVITRAVVDDQLTRLRSGHRRTEGHANRARRFGDYARLARRRRNRKMTCRRDCDSSQIYGLVVRQRKGFRRTGRADILLRIDSAGRRQCRRFDARPRQGYRLRTINGVIGKGEHPASLTQSHRREGNAHHAALLPSERRPTGVRGDREVTAGRDAADRERARACVFQRHRPCGAGRADHLSAKTQGDRRDPGRRQTAGERYRAGSKCTVVAIARIARIHVMRSSGGRRDAVHHRRRGFGRHRQQD